MSQTYMKEKPVFSLLMQLSLPMVLSMLVSALYNIVDTWFVGKISEDAITALSLVFPLQNLINAVAIGFGVGVSAVISMDLGAGNLHRAGNAARWGLIFNGIHGVLLTIFCIGGLGWFLSIYNPDPDVFSLAMKYGTIAFLFSLPNCLAMTHEKIHQSLGNMVLAMSCVLAGCIGNILLDPLLIFGWGFIPAMGVSGAALATGISQTVPLIMYWIYNALRPLPWKGQLGKLQFSGRLTKQLYGIGVPSALNLALPSLMISLLNGLLSAFGQSYVTVLGVYYKLQTFLYLPGQGLLQGMRPLIGYNAGAGEWKRVRTIFFETLWLFLGVMAIGLVLCQTIPGWLMAQFSSNTQTVALGEQALRIISLGYLFSALSVTASGALEGLGHGLASFTISALRSLVLLVPAAWVLSVWMGAQGVWWAFVFAEIFASIAAWLIWSTYLKQFQSRNVQNSR